jgi:plastocyanin
MDNTRFKAPSVAIQPGQSLTLTADTPMPHFIANGTWEGANPRAGAEPGAPKVANIKIDGNDSGVIGPFTTAGTFQFYCTIHPGMNLAVTVQ